MPWINDALSFLGLGWLGTLLGIGGIAFGFLTYIWTRRRTKMAFVHLGEHLLGSASDALPPKIVVQYDGISIPRLTKTQVILWNNGENTVAGSDIVVKDPLRLQVGEDGRILSISVLKASRAVNDVQVVSTIGEHPNKPNEAMLKFDFLDANDGVVVEILHTSTDRKPRVKGTLRGLPKGFTNLGQFTRPKPQKNLRSEKLSKIISTIAVLAACTSAFLTAMSTLSPGPFPHIPETISSASSAVVGALMGFAGMWAINALTSRRRYPRSLHLEALE